MVTGISLIVVFAVLLLGPKVIPIGCKAGVRFDQKLIIGSPLTARSDQYKDLLRVSALVRAPIADIPSIFKLRKETLNKRVLDRFSSLIKFQVALCDVSCV